MNRTKTRTIVTLACAAAVCLVVIAPRGASAAKGIKKGDAQKAIAAAPPFELNSGAVSIKEISSTETAATVIAGVKVAIRFVRAEGGVWRATDVRVGDRKWEDFDLLARAAGAERVNASRAALDAFAAELDAAALARKRDKAKADAGKSEAESDKTAAGGGKAEGGDKAKAVGSKAKAGGEADAEEPLVRGALRVEKPSAALAAMGSSAVVETEIEAAFELVRERGKWRVAGVRVGGETVSDLSGLARALDAAKGERARADLERLASALEAFRRERGFYVVADTGPALVDHLTPRYMKEYVRFDPWHRSYDYEGTAAGFLLRSNGPDGKPGTPDDVTLRK